MGEDELFVIESPTRIRLSPTAKEWAQAWGLSLPEMARFLLTREKLRSAGVIEGEF